MTQRERDRLLLGLLSILVGVFLIVLWAMAWLP